jgi:TonB family protein
MMTIRRLPPLTLALLLAGLAPTAIGGAQDPLTRAKDFYAAAAYEDALLALGQVPSKGQAAEIEAYRIYCLLALGRNQEATTAIESMVRVDPLFHPTEADASPRVRAFFEKVRRPLLPDAVRQLYAKGKEAFYRKDMPTASLAFDRVVFLLEDMDVSENQELADLRTLAGGFRELSKAPPPLPPPVPVVSAQPSTIAAKVPAAPSNAMRIYGPDDQDVTRPVIVARVVPRWRPINATEERLQLEGTIEVLVSERGTALSVSITRSVHPRYDPLLLQAAKDWTFRPAMRNGVPVKYRYPFDIRLSGASQ